MEVRKVRSSWCVLIDGKVISDHATRDGAVAAYRNLVRAEQEYGRTQETTDG